MDPNTLPPEVQEAMQRRQGAPAQGAPSVPQAPVDQAVPPPMPPEPAVDPNMPAPTPEVPFDVQEIKMIEGALINRLKAITDMQKPPEPSQMIMGGQ